MWNPFKKTTRTVKPRSRLESVINTLLLVGCVVVVGTWLSPGLVGKLVKSSGRTFVLLLVFLMAARALSGWIGRLFKPRG